MAHLLWHLKCFGIKAPKIAALAWSLWEWPGQGGRLPNRLRSEAARCLPMTGHRPAGCSLVGWCVRTPLPGAVLTTLI